MFTLENWVVKKIFLHFGMPLLCTSHHASEEPGLGTGIGSHQLATEMLYSDHLCIDILHYCIAP